MKITIEENKQKRTYPYLGKDGSGLIACFTSPEKGVVIKGDEFHKTGRKFDSFNELAFTPMHPQPEPVPEPIPIEQRKYPYVGKSDNGNVVMFIYPDTGMLIGKGTATLDIGNGNCFSESQFTPIPVTRIIIDLE